VWKTQRCGQSLLPWTTTVPAPLIWCDRAAAHRQSRAAAANDQRLLTLRRPWQDEFEHYLHTVSMGKGLISASYGVGIEARRAPSGEIVVSDVAEDGPAGGKMHVGDVLLQVNGKEMHGKHSSDVWQALHGVIVLQKSVPVHSIASPDTLLMPTHVRLVRAGSRKSLFACSAVLELRKLSLRLQ
jgi:hypothetical protein